MGHLAERFFDQQAVLRLSEIDSPAADFAGDALIIAVGVEAEQRQAKAIFPPGSSVATAGVATGFGEHRHHVEMKTDRPISGGILHHQRHLHAAAAVLDRDFRLTIGLRVKHVGIEPHQISVSRGDFRFGRDVTRQLVVVYRLHNQRLAVRIGVQIDRWREYF